MDVNISSWATHANKEPLFLWVYVAFWSVRSMSVCFRGMMICDGFYSAFQECDGIYQPVTELTDCWTAPTCSLDIQGREGLRGILQLP